MCNHHAAELRTAGAAGLKAIAKACPGALRAPGAGAGAAVAALLERAADGNVRVKGAGERGLLHVLAVHTRPATLVRAEDHAHPHARSRTPCLRYTLYTLHFPTKVRPSHALSCACRCKPTNPHP